MSSEEMSIQVDGLSKCFNIYSRPLDRIKNLVMPHFDAVTGRESVSYHREFWALKNVSFTVTRGETVGIIGRNGSGKSTLLQMICGTLTPTNGHVETTGRVAALLELGAGFNPEFTGRENIYMNGTTLGLSRQEIEARFEDIVAFADIGEFVEQPVKHYSSGMYARLAFAVAINVDPHILVVDEALSVGDEPFQRKCFSRINEMKAKGCTILFVSHSGSAIINLCDRAILLDRGERLFTGIPKLAVFFSQQLGNTPIAGVAELVAKIRSADSNDIGVLKQEAGSRTEYESFKSESYDCSSAIACPGSEKGGATNADGIGAVLSLNKVPRGVGGHDELRPFLNPDFVSETCFPYEERGARIENPGLYTLEGEKVNHILRGSRYVLRCGMHFYANCPEVRLYALIRTTEGIDLAGCVHPSLEITGIDMVADTELTVDFEFTCAFNPGTFFCNFAIQGINGSLHHRIVDALVFRVLSDGATSATGIIDIGYEASVFRKPC